MESVDDWREAPPPRDSSTSLDVGFRTGEISKQRVGSRWFRGIGIGPLLDQQGDDMVTYVGLLSFTEKGIQGIKDTTKRSVAAREAAKKFGVNMREILWTMGKYDIVCVLEAEDEQALAAFNLATAMQGNLRSHSLRAYSADEMDKILAKLP